MLLWMRPGVVTTTPHEIRARSISISLYLAASSVFVPHQAKSGVHGLRRGRLGELSARDTTPTHARAVRGPNSPGKTGVDAMSRRPALLGPLTSHFALLSLRALRPTLSPPLPSCAHAPPLSKKLSRTKFICSPPTGNHERACKHGTCIPWGARPPPPPPRHLLAATESSCFHCVPA